MKEVNRKREYEFFAGVCEVQGVIGGDGEDVPAGCQRS